MALRALATDLESQIRAEALAVYAANGSKKPHPAVTVKQFTMLEYDKRLALAYCQHNIPEAVRLDGKLFEKVAAITKPAFVTERIELRAQIATDLSAYADVAEVADAAEG